MQSFEEFQVDVEAFAERAKAFINDHPLDLVLGDAMGSRSAMLIVQVANQILPGFANAVKTRSVELTQPASAPVHITEPLAGTAVPPPVEPEK